MFNITTLITIIAVSLSMDNLKLAHLQEYDFIDDMPAIEVTANRIENSSAASQHGMMPVIEVTASKLKANTTANNDIPEIIVTAPRYSNTDIKPYYGIMPEVVITAERYHQSTARSSIGRISDGGIQEGLPKTNRYTRNDVIKLTVLFTILSAVGYVINKPRTSVTALKQ